MIAEEGRASDPRADRWTPRRSGASHACDRSRACVRTTREDCGAIKKKKLDRSRPVSKKDGAVLRFCQLPAAASLTETSFLFKFSLGVPDNRQTSKARFEDHYEMFNYYASLIHKIWALSGLWCML